MIGLAAWKVLESFCDAGWVEWNNLLSPFTIGFRADKSRRVFDTFSWAVVSFLNVVLYNIAAVHNVVQPVIPGEMVTNLRIFSCSVFFIFRILQSGKRCVYTSGRKQSTRIEHKNKKKAIFI